MNKRGMRLIGMTLGVVAALLLVFSAFADIASFELTSGPVDQDPNWVWTGNVSLTNTTSAHRFLCIGFPNASPAVADVPCTNNILNAGETSFTCTVPKSNFANVPNGTPVTWQIFASSSTAGNCTGNIAIATSGSNWYPTAVSMVGFGASALSTYIWVVAIMALALLTAAVLMNRRHVAVQQA